MKIRVELDETVSETEIVIRCKELSREVLDIQKGIADIINSHATVVLYKNDIEFYLSIDEILFFETDGNVVSAHTKDNVYYTKVRLYELEKLLPSAFMRISKSAICNTNQIYALDRSIASICNIQFHGTKKQVYVSRHYYRLLRDYMEEKRRHL